MALAGYLPPVVAEVVAEVGKFTAGMQEAKTEVTGFQSAVTKMAGAGKVALAGLAVGATAVGYESIKMAANFDQAMEMIHTQAGASQTEVDDLKEKVLALAPTVGIGPEKLAEGLYHIESSGLRGAQALDVLEASAKLAKIGMADLDDVTYAMSGVMAVGMKDVKNATDAIAFMNATVGMGDMRMGQLAAAIGTGILPSFKSAGLGMTDFSAAIATIADNSTPADEAATRLRMTISMMAAPSHPAIEALSRIGLQATSLATDLRQPNGLLVAMEDLKKHLEDSGLTAVEQTQVLEQAFGGGKTSGSILTMLEEIDKLKSKYDQLGTAESRTTTVDQAWQDQQKQAKQQWDELVAKMEAYGVKLGNWLIPKVMDAVDWTTKHKDAVEIFAGVVTAVLIPAIVAYTITLAQAAIANIAATWEILAFVAAIALMAYELHFMITHFKEDWDWFAGWTKNATHDIAQWWHNMTTSMSQSTKDMWDGTVGPFFDKVKGAYQWVHDHFPMPTWGSSSSASLPSFDTGGTVPGPPGAPMLAVVHGGEQILTPDQQASMGRSGTFGPATGPGGDGGDIVINLRMVTPDGKTLNEQQLRYARRAGRTPADLYPATARAF